MVLSEKVEVVKRRKPVLVKASHIDRRAQIEAGGFNPFFRRVESNSGVRWKVEGKECLIACSNDYLGLACDERVKSAARRALN